jgi:hypothetical protein
MGAAGRACVCGRAARASADTFSLTRLLVLLLILLIIIIAAIVDLFVAKVHPDVLLPAASPGARHHDR